MIIVTGAAGFIGSALIWKLNCLGESSILAVDQNAQHSLKWKNLQGLHYQCYLESDEFIDQLKKNALSQKIRAIFHLGACSDTTETNIAFLKNNNTLYTQHLAEWALKNNIYFSYASSAAVYGSGEFGFSDAYTLTPLLKPLNPYGQSKLDFDNWVLKNHLEKSLTGFRFFNVYGPNEYHKENMRSLAQKGFEQIQATGKLRLFKSYQKEYPDGGQKRDFIYIKDVVDVMLWFYRHPHHTGIYNLGTGRAQSWNELAEALFKACKKPVRIEYIEMPDSLKNQYQYFTEADLKKLKETGCPALFQNLDEGVSDYVIHYLLAPNSRLVSQKPASCKSQKMASL